MKNVLKGLGLTKIENGLVFISTIALVGIVVVFAFEIVGRYFLGTPVPDSNHIIALFLLIHVFFSFAYTQREEGQISINTVVDRLTGQTKKKIQLLWLIIQIVVYGFITYGSWLLFIKSYKSGRLAGLEIGLPDYVGRIVIIIGLIFMGIRIIVQIVKSISEILARSQNKTKN